MTARLLVFTKEPHPGRVKTRLVPALGEEAAASLAWACLDDTCRWAYLAAEEAGAALEVHHDPARPTRRFEDFLRRRGISGRPQAAGGLGERLAQGLRGAHGARLAVGSDAPDLPQERVEAAIRATRPGRVVLIPAPDGGYVLIGLGRGVAAEPLASPSIRWSSPDALADTQAAFEEAGTPVLLLEPWPDLDDPADLAALRARLDADPQGAPACASWLASHGPPPASGSDSP